MSITEYGFCPSCEDRRELIMNEAGCLQCHACDNMDFYDSREEYERMMEERGQQ